MGLATGTPLGNVINPETTVVEGSPYIYFQDSRATPLYNPDGDGYYWGLSGTSTYPVYKVGCAVDVSFTEDVTMNPVNCDNVGTIDTIQKRNFVEFQLTITSIFPFTVLAPMLNLSTPTVGSDQETMGIGSINNDVYYMVYAPKVYNQTLSKWMMLHLNKAKFVDAWTINFRSGDVWQVTGLKLRGHFDDSKPAGSEFGTWKRWDSAI